jgi:hypothetical protein
MTPDEPMTTQATESTEPARADPRSGTGADTALQAMLKKRRLRVGDGADAQAPPAPSGETTAGD